MNRCFIATVYDEQQEVDQAENQHLCRYKFMELVVRLAHVKYYESELIDTVHQSVEEFISKSILPNRLCTQDQQVFREEHIWSLDVDDVIRLNERAI